MRQLPPPIKPKRGQKPLDTTQQTYIIVNDIAYEFLKLAPQIHHYDHMMFGGIREAVAQIAGRATLKTMRETFDKQWDERGSPWISSNLSTLPRNSKT